MSKKQIVYGDCCGTEIYEIRVKGHVQDRYEDWFECMTITRKDDGTTTLYGRLPDQTALHGVLLKIRNMNLKLISVTEIDSGDETKIDC